MGKYQLDYKSQVAVTKFHEKQQIEKLRAEYLKKKQKQTDK
ncbi:hypothetical protein PDN64_13240 [Bacillus cereus group sp. Bc256]|nr:hypothetical protein [Bacillus cereus group sp. Bc256]MDA2139087.1 hypothetical protein [Bacillus cereus group sp. Bc256]